MALTCRAKHINYILEVSCATFCNLIGAQKFLNRDTLDVHNSPDPFSRPGGCRGGSGYETRCEFHAYNMGANL